MKKYALSLILIISLLISACTGENQSVYTKYSYEFLGAFDTVIQFMGYTKGPDEFEIMVELGQGRFMELNKLYDIYNDYDGINNLKSINDNAGIKPVEVKQEIIDLIMFSKEWYNKTNGKCNIALGSVLLWLRRYTSHHLGHHLHLRHHLIHLFLLGGNLCLQRLILVDNNSRLVNIGAFLSICQIGRAHV